MYCLASLELICVCFAACDFENHIIRPWWEEQTGNGNTNGNAMPVILTHPRSASYIIGTPAEDLTVTAAARNGEQLSYQWYTNDTDDNKGGSLIPNATERYYTPSTDYEGITYYYVVVSGMIVDNNGSGNITANAISHTAEIEVDKILHTVTITGLSIQDKIYDGTTTATIIGVPVLNGVAAGDDVTLVIGTAEFADGNAGLNKSIIFKGWSLVGADAGNYWLRMPGLTANITTSNTAANTVTITGLSAQNKVYDGTMTATVIGTPVLHGVAAGDDVTLVIGAAGFADKNAGVDKTIIFRNWLLAGADADNYILQIPYLTAHIAEKIISVDGLSAMDKLEDYSVTATVTGTPVLNGVLSGDDVTLIPGYAAFEDSVRGTNKKIIFSGWWLAGADAINYKLKMPNLTAEIIGYIVVFYRVNIPEHTAFG
jgi:hypothetical protein